MIDEKSDRAQGGLQGSNSKYLCNLCHATRDTARSNVGSFSITHSFKETLDTASSIQTNPENLSHDKLAEGVKDYPILRMDPDQKLIDATHEDINLGSFFQKLIVHVCEMARTCTWEIACDVKVMFEDAEKRFNDHIRASLGLAPTLMMPGNHACRLFDSRNIDTILELIPDPEKKEHLSEVVSLFRKLREVYRAHRPLQADVATYKVKAVQMADLLGRHFPYATWPNYLLKIIEHVQEMLEDLRGPGTIGDLSGEGNEAANKLFRDLRHNFSRKNCTLDSLRDILWMHWLYTSPKLRRMVMVASRSYKFTHCNDSGHNILTCTSK